MALVTIVGYPCSGKTKRANELKSNFEERLLDPKYEGPKLKVVVVDDDSVHVERSVYDSSLAEKSGRANLYSSVLRNMNTETIVICDSANYIKGFRYQMYCAAREAHVRVATIHVATPPQQCKEWHEKRGECSYKPATFDNLIMRFEEPSSMVRWDSPLFVIPSDEDPPHEAIWSAITTGYKKPPTSAVARPKTTPVNSLSILSSTLSTIMNLLLEHMKINPSASEFRIPSPPAPSRADKGKGKEEENDLGLILRLPMKTITLSEMQRLKRQFEQVQVKNQTNHSKGAGSWREDEVAVKFVSFLENVWDTAD